MAVKRLVLFVSTATTSSTCIDPKASYHLECLKYLKQDVPNVLLYLVKKTIQTNDTSMNLAQATAEEMTGKDKDKACIHP